ncbi:FMN-binding negative transcriptional regulator [Salinibacterium sp. ZJ450]|uniref:FMN-binding negative transcriptional regulator n=1 Tax=Salinibacterium sp. ZJ450 TaxID=2708338 RepID=UPI001421BEAD|nr:FMN-binding negative transcriptional regulator [Salinibacterium sp. ZJ450]
MLPTAHFLLEDPDEVKRLIRENPWATFVSATSAGLIASHYPVLLEEDAAGISIVSHFGRPDDVAHELGRHEILVIIQGPHGYVSPGWYDNGEFIPTWNHVTAHLYGVPELLDADENFRILGDLVDHFEKRMPHPQRLEQHEAVARAVARGTIGLRLRVTRFDARRKLSQNKTPEVLDRITRALESDDEYAEPRLAREMRRATGHADH